MGWFKEAMSLFEEAVRQNKVYHDMSTGKSYIMTKDGLKLYNDPKGKGGKGKGGKGKGKEHQKEDQKGKSKGGDGNGSWGADGDSPDISTDAYEKYWKEERRKRAEQIAREQKEDGITPETAEEKKIRLSKIKEMSNSEDFFKQGVKEASKVVEKERRADERRKQQAEENAKRMDAYRPTEGMDQFEISLEKYMESCARKVRQNTYKIDNPSYEGSGIQKKGRRRQKDIVKPSFSAYMDCSGSCSSHVQRFKKIMASVKQKYADTGLLDFTLYFFADYVATTEDEAGSGTRVDKVVEHIRETHPENVIILTDNDGAGQPLEPTLLQGGVWMCFAGGMNCITLQERLRGMMGNEYFSC